MKRRAFSILLVGAAAAPLHAQQRPMPVIGWLSSNAAGSNVPNFAAFHRGLREQGYVEGQNVAVDYRWADDQHDRIPALAADLVGRKVDVIATVGIGATASVVQKATATIPVVFGTGGDPVARGLVASLARPGGNLTGVNYLVAELGAKRLDLLSQTVPRTGTIGLLVNPANTDLERLIRQMQEAASARQVQLLVVKAANEREIDEAFAALAKGGAGGLVVLADPFMNSRRGQLVGLAARHAIPTVYAWRDFVDEGGLMSYGPSLPVVYHQIGNYVGKILKGARPADLPVVQPTTFEFVVNLRTARTLGLDLPSSMLALADEVIE